MKIEHLDIKNFRGIKSAQLTELQSMVVIAGQNGSGKSCVLDAIRLLKSVYGGYQQNEWHHWMGEFQINFQNSADILTLLNDPTAEMRISCRFGLHSEEREYLRQNGEDLVRQTIWQTMFPELYGWSSFSTVSLAAQLRTQEADIQKQTKIQTEAMTKELARESIVGEFIIKPGQNPQVTPSKVLEVVFGIFRPHFLGVIDYHGPHRIYGREQLQGINLNLDVVEQQRSQHALYNYGNKYQNVKSEMAGSYIKEIVAREAGTQIGGKESLASTLQELFRTFFPDKEFLGPKPTPDGRLNFPVRMTGGATHDLNELSAGEKEVLYGYLRLRNSAPRYSVILLDEPELHLNPRLIRGLPTFYHKHLGIALNNQIWLITHSDALLREVVGKDDYSVFHMQAMPSGKSQAIPLVAKEGLQRAIIDLVGDLASFRPDAKIVIFEGESSEFDQRMTSSLFPEFHQQVNAVSAGSKQRVRGLHSILSAALEKGEIPMKVFSIVDADAEDVNSVPEQTYAWNVYHIENYLLEPRFILKVANDMGSNLFKTEQQVYDALRSCARETMKDLIRHKLASSVNAALVASIRTATDPASKEIAPLLDRAIRETVTRISDTAKDQYELAKLQKAEAKLKREYEKHLASDAWRRKFRGRDVLHRFVGRVKKTSYEVFRDLIIANMRDAAFRPKGMKLIIEKIIKA